MFTHLQVKTVSLFSRFRNSQPANNAGDAASPVILQINDQQVTVSPDQIQGSTIRDLFRRFLSDQINVDNINTFVAAGTVIDGTVVPNPGQVIRAAVTAESKG